jgi:excisionase family DNA binding protein
MSEPTNPRALSVEQLADRWQVNVKTIYEAIRAGQVPAMRLGRVLRVSMAVVESIETQGCVVLEGVRNASTT